MGKLKDQISQEDEWKTYQLSEAEVAYLKSMMFLANAMIKNMQDMFVTIETTFLQSQVAPRFSYKAGQSLEFDLNFDDGKRELKIREVR